MVFQLTCLTIVLPFAVSFLQGALGEDRIESLQHAHNFLGRSLAQGEQGSGERCWPAFVSKREKPGTEAPVGKVSYARCLTHHLDHEWNYFHLFERNLLSVFSTLQHYGLNKNSGAEATTGLSQVVAGSAAGKQAAVIYEGAVNIGLLRGWMKALTGADVHFMGDDSDTHPEICCASTDSATGFSSSWPTVMPQFRDHMYKQAGVSLIQGGAAQQHASTEGRRQACFLNRNTKGRGRAFINLDALTQAAKDLGYEPTALVFEGKSPAEQVKMLSACHVSMGIHGAGLTNFMWMQPRSLAIQIAPYQSSTGFIGSYQSIAEASGLRYSLWEPPSPDLVQVHWEQMKDDKHVLEQVCACGVRQILEHGTSGGCDSSAEIDFLNWGFYINQDVTVPVETFKNLLIYGSPTPSSHSILQRAREASVALHASSSASESSSSSSVKAFAAVYASEMALYQQVADAVIDGLRQMSVEEAEELCKKRIQ